MAGKLPKGLVLYSETAPPPAVYRYECRLCAHFISPNQCALVEGDVAPAAWCLMWLPLLWELPFAWMFTGGCLNGSRCG